MYLVMHSRWYFGGVSRTESEKRLYEEGNQVGSYLVRQSETVPCAYSLSVRFNERVIHYRIVHELNMFHITPRSPFQSIPGLVSHYQQRSDGLPISLMYPCVSLVKPQTVGLCMRENDDWEIDRREIRFLKNIGTGNHAEVWGGLWNGTVPIAVKTLKSKEGTAESDFLQEASLMKTLHHPKLVHLFGVCTKELPFCIITEFMKHGSLLIFLRDCRQAPLKLHQLISMAEQIAEGMAYLEEQNYVHRDVAARNILVGDGMVCKVADFGLTRLVSEAGCNNSGRKFAIKWTAPEALLFQKFTVKSDVWSFGVLLYEIITYGRFPYPGLLNAEVVEKVTQGYRMSQPMDCSYMYYNIMLKCWREKPENRPCFEGLQWELKEFLESTR